jgi:hypothetical protein
MKAYLAVTSHWISQDWKLCSELLSFKELEGSHSGENIGMELYKVLDKFGIKDKVCLDFFDARGDHLTFKTGWDDDVRQSQYQ